MSPTTKLAGDGFVVRYKVEDFDEEFVTEEYATEDIARQHASDIRSFEYVEHVVVIPASALNPSSSGNG
jgi:hypothetical protein